MSTEPAAELKEGPVSPELEATARTVGNVLGHALAHALHSVDSPLESRDGVLPRYLGVAAEFLFRDSQWVRSEPVLTHDTPHYLLGAKHALDEVVTGFKEMDNEQPKELEGDAHICRKIGAALGRFDLGSARAHSTELAERVQTARTTGRTAIGNTLEFVLGVFDVADSAADSFADGLRGIADQPPEILRDADGESLAVLRVLTRGSRRVQLEGWLERVSHMSEHDAEIAISLAVDHGHLIKVESFDTENPPLRTTGPGREHLRLTMRHLRESTSA